MHSATSTYIESPPLTPITSYEPTTSSQSVGIYIPLSKPGVDLDVACIHPIALMVMAIAMAMASNG